MALKEPEKKVTDNGAAGTTAGGDAAKTEKKDKVSLKDRVSNALNKKREFTVGGILKTVGFIAAIPVAVLVGRGLQKAEDQQLLDGLGGDTYTPEPQPLSLPAPEQEVQQDTAIDVEYTEVE